MSAIFFALLVGLTVGVLLGLALADAPLMPACPLCGREESDCTCHGPDRR